MAITLKKGEKINLSKSIKNRSFIPTVLIWAPVPDNTMDNLAVSVCNWNTHKWLMDSIKNSNMRINTTFAGFYVPRFGKSMRRATKTIRIRHM